mgnify:CR=1 FL=1
MSDTYDLLKGAREKLAGILPIVHQSDSGHECEAVIKACIHDLEKAMRSTLAHEQRDRLFDDLYYSVGSSLNSTFDQDELLGNIIDALELLIGFDAAGIFLVEQNSGNILAEFIRGYADEFKENVRQKVGEGVLGWVIQRGESANIPDVVKDPRYINARPATSSELAVPMFSEKQVIGCINLESDKPAAFSDEDLVMLETFSTQASLAVQRAQLYREITESRRLEEEVELARSIQSGFLPKKPPSYKEYDLAGINIPSSEVGGDYYDFIKLLDGGLGLAIADVSGKGVGAAFIMSGFRAALRAEVRHNLEPVKLMHKVNHYVYESTSPGNFVTAFYGALNGGEFTYVNAGHNPPILLRNDGNHTFLEDGGLVLGVNEEQFYRQGQVKLDFGDTLLLYTDGVTETLNSIGEEFGVVRLLEALQDYSGLDAEEQIRQILKRAKTFSAGANVMDDITIMIVRRR